MDGELKKDTVVILRIDGEELEEFVKSPTFEAEAMGIFSRRESVDSTTTMREMLSMALAQLSIDHGMPPSSDSWVVGNIVEPLLDSVPDHVLLDESVSEEMFLVELKKILEGVIQCIKEHPVIVAHSECVFDGVEIGKLLSNESELAELLEAVWSDLSKGQNQGISVEALNYILNAITPFSGLSSIGASNDVYALIERSFREVEAENENASSEMDFKNMVKEILERIMVQLQATPITVSSYSVVHGHLTSSSSATSSISQG